MPVRCFLVGLIALSACGKGDSSSNSDGSDPTEETADCRAAEVPYDGIDNDCVGGDLVDVDEDGFDGEAVGGPDCDDEAADVHPDAVDPAGDGLDANCDGTDGVDGDQDGIASVESGGGDCDDGDAGVLPGADDPPYDDVDQDCAGDCDWDFDGDGTATDGAPITEDDACDTVAGTGLPSVADCDDNDPAATWAMITTDPLQGSSIATDATFRATFTGDASDAVLSVTDGQGNGIAGVTTFEGPVGEIAVFTPDLLLDAGANYTFEVSSPCDDAVAVVTTLIDPVNMVGNTWHLDWASGNWISPAGFGLVAGLVINDSEPILVEVLATDTVRVGAEDPAGGQDVCLETTDTELDLTANPAFSTAPALLHINGTGMVLSLEEGVISGRVQASGAVLTAELAGSLDVLPLGDVLGYDACAILGMVGVNCSACPSNGRNTCLQVALDAIPVTTLQGVPLTERTATDVRQDPLCQ